MMLDFQQRTFSLKTTATLLCPRDILQRNDILLHVMSLYF